MSYEKKMRDLMKRLVAMTPDPPPNPEEITMTHRETRRSRPVLMFAGAAALVVLLAVPFIWFSGGGDPDNVADSTTSTAAPITTTTLPTTTTSAPEGTSTTSVPEVGVTWTGYVYVYQTPENSFLGNPALVPILVAVDFFDDDVPDEPETVNFTDALAKMSREDLIPEPYESAVPPEVMVLGEVEGEFDGDSVIHAEMSPEFANGAGGLLADFTLLNQLIYTLTIGNESHGVLFTIGGEPVTQFGSEGLDLSQPVGRESFIDHLALIFVTELALLDTDDQIMGELTVSGWSNTFEASMAIDVLDGSGNVVVEQFIQATSGSGTWGTYSATLDGSLIVPGDSSIRLFSYSPEDGAGMIDVITIPIPEEGAWDLTGRDAISR